MYSLCRFNHSGGPPSLVREFADAAELLDWWRLYVPDGGPQHHVTRTHGGGDVVVIALESPQNQTLAFVT